MPQRNPGGFRGLIGVARRDVTPPVGIYARMWGAAKHDQAEGVHKPLGRYVFNNIKFSVHDPLVAKAKAAGYRTFDDPYNKDAVNRKSTRLNSSHIPLSRMPSSA